MSLDRGDGGPSEGEGSNPSSSAEVGLCGLKLVRVPCERITGLVFSTSETMLAVSSWEGRLFVYTLSSTPMEEDSPNPSWSMTFQLGGMFGVYISLCNIGVYKCVYVCVYVFVSGFMYSFVVCVCVCVCVCVDMYICMCVCMFMCVCICTCVCVYSL